MCGVGSACAPERYYNIIIHAACNCSCLFGRWEVPIIEHYCEYTCGDSVEDCVDSMLGACLNLDLLMQSDSVNPSLDDWCLYDLLDFRRSFF